MLDAAVKLLKRYGSSSITTNRIAETAGVSIGSVYQYFPDKRAIFIALHERHIRHVDGVICKKIAECADSSLEDLVASLVDGMIEAHAIDPELSELLHSEVPHRAGGTRDFSARFHDIFRAALVPHAKTLRKRVDLDVWAFFLTNMIEALGHAITLRRPRGLSLSRAKVELHRAILAYLDS